jgi:membrane-associated phospholipid phosphatase
VSGAGLPSSGSDMLSNHRRAFWYAVVLLGSMILVFVAIGRHTGGDPTATTFPFVGRWDLAVFHATDDIRFGPLTILARALNVVGSGVVTIPLRIGVAIWLTFRRRWRALATWLLTWAAAEIVLSVSKGYFARARPPDPLVGTNGHSFPSGHAVAAAATAVALVIVLLPPGPKRRRWELAAAGFAFVMACSRVYLHAHWLSDVVAGVLLGSGIALGSAALVTEVRDIALRLIERRRGPAVESRPDATPP